MSVNPSSSSIVRLLRDRAGELPGVRAYTYLSGGEAVTLTYAELDLRARTIAAHLQRRCAAGERALLLYPPSMEYIAGFYGCLAAGCVAVPGYPPRMNRSLDRLESIIDDARPKVALTTSQVLRQIREHASGSEVLSRVEWIATDGQLDESPDAWLEPRLTPDTLAFLQYTSASTAAPKGVMVTHGNVLHNERLMKEALHHDGETVIVSWLPMFHDMGLIGVVLATLYNGARAVMMAPADFLKRPLAWLEAVTKYRGTFSGAPDFGYQLCVDNIPLPEREALDLSSWRAAFNGSEPVRAATIRNFTQAFAPHGFRPEAMFPCYGLAEHTLFAAGGFSQKKAAFTRDSLEAHRPVAGDGVELVSCGVPCGDETLVIADPDTRRQCAEREIGEIWLGGPSVAHGYWNRGELSEETFGARLADERGPFLRTGDLGFIHDGELFVTGRIKDLIIVRGRNLIPQDIEQLVENCCPAIRPGFVAAVSFEQDGAERVAIAAEIKRESRHAVGCDALIGHIRREVAKEFDVQVSAVALLKPGALPKTSSGKTQRGVVRRDFLAGKLDALQEWRSTELAPEQKAAATPAAQLERWLIDHIAARAKIAREQVDPESSLHSFGLDSVDILMMLGEAERTFNVDLDVETLFAGTPSLRELVRRITSESPRKTPPPAQRVENVLRFSSARIPVAKTPAPAPPPTIIQRKQGREHAFRSHVNPELGRMLAQMGMDKTFVRGEGCWLWDQDGRKYLDFLAQYGALPFGFNPPRIWAALNNVQTTGEPSFVQPSFLDAAGELAKRLIAAAPPGMRYATFGNSGAEAIEAAIKLCRSATGRMPILAATNGFHGKTLGALSATAKEKYQKPFGAPVEGFEYVEYGDIDALRRKLAGGRFAGFIVEPVQGEGGIVEPPAGYLRLARKACREHGTLFVADEIQTGLGRTGAMFVCSELGITPDVMTVAKALGGGLMPIGACLSTAAVYNDLFACKHTSTFAGNTLACRAGIATLDLLEENGQELIARVAKNGARLKLGLLALQKRYPGLIEDVRGRGYLLGIRFTLDRHDVDEGLLGYLGEQEALTALVVSHLLEIESVRVGYTLNQGGVLRVEPPLTATWAECEHFLGALERVLARIQRRDLAALTAQVTGFRGGEGPRVIAPARPRMPFARQKSDGHFAFLAHPLAWKDYRDLDESLAPLNETQLGKLSTAFADNFDPLVIGETRVVGNDGSSAYGEFILVPRRAEELTAMEPSLALAEVMAAAELAKKRGARIIGLGAYTSVVTQGGVALKGAGLPALTTGNSYTAIATHQTIRLAAEKRGWTLPRRTVGILGAGGAIGQALSILLSRDAGRLVLLGNPNRAGESHQRLLQVAGRIVCAATEAGRRMDLPSGSVASWVSELDFDIPEKPDRAALARLGRELIRRTGAVVASVDYADFLPEVDLVVCCTSTPDKIVRPELLHTSAVVCDVSRPPNVPSDLALRRPDVMVIDGGIVQMPNGSTLGFNAAIGEGRAYACMAETMMLAMKHRDTDTSLGYDLALDQLFEMERLAGELGFRAILQTKKVSAPEIDHDRPEVMQSIS